MYSPTGADPSGAWPSASPFMLQMVPVPVFNSSAGGYPSQMNPRQGGGCCPPVAAAGDGEGTAGLSQQGEFEFRYSSDNIVLAAGQYREIRPTAAATGSCRFHCEPEELPTGLQLDVSTGIIWGTPQPQPDMDPAGPYHSYKVVLSSPVGSASTTVGLKVVHFQPQDFKITHISQIERSKYMVLIDTHKR